MVVVRDNRRYLITHGDSLIDIFIYYIRLKMLLNIYLVCVKYFITLGILVCPLCQCGSIEYPEK